MATPGAGTNVPIWLLGSSLFSAQLAAHLGLPYAFASHFAPRMLYQAVQLYRSLFKPSAQLARPYVVVGAPVIAAPTDEEAEYLASSTYQRVLGIITGRRGLLPRPVENYAAQLGEQERRAIGDFLAVAAIGGPDQVRTRLQSCRPTPRPTNSSWSAMSMTATCACARWRSQPRPWAAEA